MSTLHARALLAVSLATTLAVAALAATVSAEPRQPTPEQKQKLAERWASADTDGDGAISRAEADAGMPRVAKHFDRLDANGDGRLSPEELKAGAAQLAGRR